MSNFEDIDESMDHDIYGDLESSVFTSTRPTTRNPSDVEKIASLIHETEELTSQLMTLRKENSTLLTNISSLYLTAKNEINKKNFIINELQKKLKDLSLSNKHVPKLSHMELNDILKKCSEAYCEAQSKVTIEEIKRAINENSQGTTKNDCNTKAFKFGNMSWYFFNEASSCQRKEVVEVPEMKTVNSNLTSSSCSSTFRSSPSKHQSKESTSRHNEKNLEITPPDITPTRSEKSNVDKLCCTEVELIVHDGSNSTDPERKRSSTLTTSTKPPRPPSKHGSDNTRRSSKNQNSKSNQSRIFGRDEDRVIVQDYRSERTSPRPRSSHADSRHLKRKRSDESSSKSRHDKHRHTRQNPGRDSSKDHRRRDF